LFKVELSMLDSRMNMFHLPCTVPSQTQPSKKCAYQDSQVSSLGRLSLTYINVSYQDK